MDLTKFTRTQLEALVYRQMVALEQGQNFIRALNDEITKRPQEDILPDEQLGPIKEGE